MNQADQLEKAQRDTIIYIQRILEDKIVTIENRIYYLDYLEEYIEKNLKLMRELQDK